MNHEISGFFFASKRNKIFASISNFASKAKVRAHPTCNMNKIDWNLPATGNHAGTICMRLAATRVQFECDLRLVTCYFAFVWRPPWYSLFATGHQTHIISLPSGSQSHANQIIKYVYFTLTIHLCHSLFFMFHSFTPSFTTFLCAARQISKENIEERLPKLSIARVRWLPLSYDKDKHSTDTGKHSTEKSKYSIDEGKHSIDQGKHSTVLLKVNYSV